MDAEKLSETKDRPVPYSASAFPWASSNTYTNALGLKEEMEVDTFTVEFRIWTKKEDLDLSAITEDLGLSPTNTRRRGEARSRSSSYTESMWGYEVEAGKEWDEIEDALESLLAVLVPLKNKIMGYSSKYDVILWCGYFKASFDGGPTFSAEMLKKLGDLGIPLYLDTYCPVEDHKPSMS